MINEVANQAAWPKDNFGWEPDMESTGGEVDRPVRSMQGEIKLKFVSPNWSADGVECNGRELICYDKTYAVIRWNDDNMPEEVIPLARGEPCPNLTEMNAAIPQSQWRTGLNGNPEPPYQLQRVLEFLDPKNMERLSWPHNVTVIGSSRAAEELEGRIKITRRLRGEDVYPVVSSNPSTCRHDTAGASARICRSSIGCAWASTASSASRTCRRRRSWSTSPRLGRLNQHSDRCCRCSRCQR